MYKNFDLVLDSRLKFTVQPLYYNILLNRGFKEGALYIFMSGKKNVRILKTPYFKIISEI